MRSAREEIVWLELVNLVVAIEEGKVAGLGNWVTTKIDDSSWFDFIEFIDELLVAAGTWWIENNRAVWRDVFGNIFGFSKDTFGIGTFGVLLHFAVGGAVNFNEREIFVAGNG